jgi:hypothetical protein
VEGDEEEEETRRVNERDERCRGVDVGLRRALKHLVQLANRIQSELFEW